MPITSVVSSENSISLLSPWDWFYDVDGTQIGSRVCGYFAAVVSDAPENLGKFSYLIFDERDPDGEPINEYHCQFNMDRRTACNYATRELRWRAEREATHRLIPVFSAAALGRTG